MARRVLAFECQYCGALKKSKTIATRHEVACMKNPDGRNCILCVHHVKLDTPVTGGGKYWCPLRDVACSIAVSANCPNFKRIEKK